MAPPFTLPRLFTSPCFLEHKTLLSAACKAKFSAWETSHHPQPPVSEAPPVNPPHPHPNHPPPPATRPHPPRPTQPPTAHQVKKACKRDVHAVCPNTAPDFNPKNLFHSACFIANEYKLSPACRKMMIEYRKWENKHDDKAHQNEHHHRSAIWRWLHELNKSTMLWVVGVFLGFTIALTFTAFFCLGIACCLKCAAQADKHQKGKKGKKTTRVSTQYQPISQEEELLLEEEGEMAPPMAIHEVRFTPTSGEMNPYYNPYAYAPYFMPPPQYYVQPLAPPKEEDDSPRRDGTQPM